MEKAFGFAGLSEAESRRRQKVLLIFNSLDFRAQSFFPPCEKRDCEQL
jgi:hypothetical protein